MEIEMQGAEAYNLFCKGFHDGDNPHRLNSPMFEEWERGWSNAMAIDQFMQEQAAWAEREVQND